VTVDDGFDLDAICVASPMKGNDFRSGKFKSESAEGPAGEHGGAARSAKHHLRRPR
jgi:hypothetical protein